jgi:PAS domain S-box-containing protein
MILLPPPDNWHATGNPALGGLPIVGLLAEVGLIQTLTVLVAGGIGTAIGAAVNWVWTNYRKARGDTIVELYRIIADKDAELGRKDVVIARREAERDKLAERSARYRLKITQLEGENAILAASNSMLQAGADPFLVHQLTNPVGYLITDRAGTISDAGPNIRAILHWRDEDLEGKNVKVLIPEEFRAAHETFMEKIRDPAVPLDPQNVLSLILMSREGGRVPVNIRIHRWEDRAKQLHFTAYVQERTPPLGGNGNGGSHSGDSGAFLRAGDPAAQKATAEMPIAGARGGA